MLELLIATSLGLLSGLLVGLLPGIGLTAFLVLATPILLNQSLLFCVLFYLVLSSSCQYFGSVMALSGGVPGENTSIPLLKYRNSIINSGNLSNALFLTAFGSLVAGVIATMGFYFLAEYIVILFSYIKTYIILLFILIGIILSIIFSDNKLWISIVLCILGYIAGQIGYNSTTNTSFLTFDNAYLYSGLPPIPIVVGLYAIPSILLALYGNTITFNTEITHNITKKILLISNLNTIIRSSIIGFLSGIIPYVGTAISSFMALFVDNRINYNKTLSNITASESANNAANIAVLIPLLTLGIAIVPSEYVLLSLLEVNNMSISWSVIQTSFGLLITFLLISNFIAYILAWNLSKYIILLIRNIGKYLMPLFLIMAIYSVWSIGIVYSQQFYYLLIMLLCIPIGLIGMYYKKIDFMPFMFIFLIQNQLDKLITQFIGLYL